MSAAAYFGGWTIESVSEYIFMIYLFFPHLLVVLFSLSRARASPIDHSFIHSVSIQFIRCRIAVFIATNVILCARSAVFLFFCVVAVRVVVFCCLLCCLCRCCDATIICKFYKLDIRSGTQWHIANKFHRTFNNKSQKKIAMNLCSPGKNRIFIRRRKTEFVMVFSLSLFHGNWHQYKCTRNSVQVHRAMALCKRIHKNQVPEWLTYMAHIITYTLNFGLHSSAFCRPCSNIFIARNCHGQ